MQLREMLNFLSILLRGCCILWACSTGILSSKLASFDVKDDSVRPELPPESAKQVTNVAPEEELCDCIMLLRRFKV